MKTKSSLKDLDQLDLQSSPELVEILPTPPVLTQNPPRRRVILTCPEESITEQGDPASFSMASIKARLDKGIVPNLSGDNFYSENPIPFNNLQDSLDFHQKITTAFEHLPAGLRRLMGNDIKNLETFVSDPSNAEVLKDYGLITQQRDSTTELVNAINTLKQPESDPAKQSKT